MYMSTLQHEYSRCSVDIKRSEKKLKALSNLGIEFFSMGKMKIA